MQDLLGKRMKEQYEDRTRYFLPRRTYTLLRLDGKAFHTYTRNLKHPFDNDLSTDIDSAIIATLPEVQGSVFAYAQSDEVSILLTDFNTIQTSAWFDGNIQKMSSVAASIMTAEFNRRRLLLRNNVTGRYDLIGSQIPLAYFDCRVFTIPDRVEVMNYFRWRQQDCIHNAVSMIAQSHFSHRELNGKSQEDMKAMLLQKGINIETDFSDGEKNGRIIAKELYNPSDNPDNIIRSRWISRESWIFTKDNGELLNMIP